MMSRPMPTHASRYLDSLPPQLETYARVDRFVAWGMPRRCMPLLILFPAAVLLLAMCHAWAFVLRVEAAAQRLWLKFSGWANGVDGRRLDRMLFRAMQIVVTFAFVVLIGAVIGMILSPTFYEVIR